MTAPETTAAIFQSVDELFDTQLDFLSRIVRCRSLRGRESDVQQRPFNSLGCIVCRSGLYSLPFLAEERQDALENQY